MIELTQLAKRLLEDMRALPPDFEKLKRDLEAGMYSPEEISMATTEFVKSDCFLERRDAEYQENMTYGGRFVPHLHSAYLYQLVELLLQYGLDPNAVFDSYNIMQSLQSVDNEYVGADTLRLLLEHGGDPFLEVDGESLFEDVDFGVMFDSVNQEDRSFYDSQVHIWFVYLGFGATLPNGKRPVDVLPERDEELSVTGEFEIKKLRNHRNYTFGLSHVPNRGESWSLHIFDKRTMWEVARL